jgi:hypothetical protein
MRRATELVLVLVVAACHAPADQPAPAQPAPAVAGSAAAPALPLERIAIVGASVSAGFGGTPFGDAFAAAAPRSAVESEADVMLFRDPIANTQAQLAKARAFHATTIFAVDLLFWDIYGDRDPRWRGRALALALDELDRARAGGAWIVVGDVPLITTAADWMLPHEQVPEPADLAGFNDRIATWAARDRVILVPISAWTEPLRAGGRVELAPGETVEARTLLALDGLHANPLGTWYVLDRLDHFLENKLPGTPKDALVFARPT